MPFASYGFNILFLIEVKKFTKVLIVDDNKPLALILREMLEEEGYEVKTAGDGDSGYLAYLFFEPDLVLTDIQMPQKNGLELMRRIRRHDPRMTAIYMSADPDRFRKLLEEEEKKFRISLLAKPFTKVELMRLLSRHC